MTARKKATDYISETLNFAPFRPAPKTLGVGVDISCGSARSGRGRHPRALRHGRGSRQGGCRVPD